MLLCHSKKPTTDVQYEIKWSLSPFSSDANNSESCFYHEFEFLRRVSESQNLQQSRSLFGKIYFESLEIGTVIAQELSFSRDEMVEFLQKVSFNQISNGSSLHPFVNFTLNQALPRSNFKVLVIGNCQVSGNYGIMFHHKKLKALDDDFYERIISSAEQEYNQFNAVIIKDIPVKDKGMTEGQLDKIGFYEIPTFPVMKMEMNPSWQSETDYINSFSSKYRIRYNASRKKGAVIKRIEMDVSSIKAFLKEIYALYMNVFNQANFKLHHVTPSYFLLLKEVFKERIFFTGYFLEDELIGFTTFLIDSKQSDAHLMGLNYVYNKEYSLYQNMLYDFVLLGIEHRSKSIDLGRTAMEIKSTVGAIPVEHSMYLRMRNPIFRKVLSRIDSTTLDTGWIQRNPFKLTGDN